MVFFANKENSPNAIIHATDEFSGRPTEAHDDRTLIVLRPYELVGSQKTGSPA
jgi:hypothetical protein